MWRTLATLAVAPPDSGILFGVVRDARTGNRIAGAAVVISWLSLQRVGRAQVMVDTREARVLSDSIGGYYACGVGADMRLEVRAHVPADSAAPGVARGYCAATIFIDGLQSSVEALGAYRTEELVGVEVYPRGSTAPGRYQRLDSECGVVLVWTKYLR